MRRSFICLQGAASPFFSELCQLLQRAGHATHRINFCGGDWLLSWQQAHSDFTGTLADLPQWLRQQWVQQGATDVLLFGDCRALHQAAIALARDMQLRVHVFEEGYLRPDWITLEQGGVNGYTGMDLTQATVRQWARSHAAAERAATPSPGAPTLLARAAYDIAYRMASAALCWRYRGYQTHRPHNGLLEYAGLARRFGLRRWFAREAHRLTARLLEAKTPYFLFPLQLNADSQIRTHSPFADVIAAVDAVLASFAAASWGAQTPPCLLVKNHPLDTGLARYRSHVEARAQALGLAGRVLFMEAGDLALLIRHARGVVLVNSTTGLAALELQCPVFALGQAIFKGEGLTHPGDLASFWQAPQPPDADYVKDFVNYIKAHSQISGDFYSRTGMQRAAAGSLQRLAGGAP